MYSADSLIWRRASARHRYARRSPLSYLRLPRDRRISAWSRSRRPHGRNMRVIRYTHCGSFRFPVCFSSSLVWCASPPPGQRAGSPASRSWTQFTVMSHRNCAAEGEGRPSFALPARFKIRQDVLPKASSASREPQELLCVPHCDASGCGFIPYCHVMSDQRCLRKPTSKQADRSDISCQAYRGS